jgi:hydrogenase maturation protease
MGDDSVGIQVVRTLKERFGTRSNLEFKELSVGGLQLVEEMLGYDRVFLIDSIESNNEKAGLIREFSPEQFKVKEQTGPPHITDFATALELYRKLQPSAIPPKIRIFTINIEPTLTFSENMSEPVRNAASKLAEQITRELQRNPRFTVSL